jgi:hypothetical protein
MERNRNFAWTVFFVVLGLIIGGVLGESLGYLFGKIGEMSGGGADNPIRNFFVKALEIDLGYNGGGWALDLYLFKVRLGFGFKFNVVSLAGMAAALYMLKWWRN